MRGLFKESYFWLIVYKWHMSGLMVFWKQLNNKGEIFYTKTFLSEFLRKRFEFVKIDFSLW